MYSGHEPFQLLCLTMDIRRWSSYIGLVESEQYFHWHFKKAQLCFGVHTCLGLAGSCASASGISTGCFPGKPKVQITVT